MPYAVTHILLTIIAVDLYRDYAAKHRKYFTLNTVFIAGLAGLLPDADIPLTWFLNLILPGSVPLILTHGGITHTLFFGLIFLAPALYFWKNKKHKFAMYFFVTSFGVFLHIFLDYLLGGGMHGGIMFFWPLSTAGFKIHLLNNLGLNDVPQALDALILLAWLYHEEVKHKIKDFF
ncbi:MAG: metal-dependent hydrolase [Candidatus Aenigmarchaeota archaeon]|nr:metal-dependent hydrolase [Candidatus Aenigmarchaeota archaeon]